MSFLYSILKRLFVSNKNFIVISFPKSGRTWLRVILDKLNIHIEYTHDGSEHAKQISYRDFSSDKTKYKEKKVIFLVRDPRDTLVSGYFQATKRLKIYDGSISDFLRDERHGMKKIIRFHDIWFDNQHVPKDLLINTYEDMHKDTLSVLKRVVSFLQREYLKDKQLTESIEFAKFENMQLLEKEGFFSEKYGSILTPADLHDQESYKVRRGKIGGYTDYLNEKDIEYCNECMKSADNSSYREFLEKHYLLTPQNS